jgi:glycosyltransferase involved in cell wall biosynthesis
VEAYASGVGVLASHIGALPEVVEHGVSGLLLPPDDVEAWQRAARQLMDDEVSIRLGRAGFATWEARYHPEIGVRDLERAYEIAIDLHSRT